jgi:hypothetical protein
MLPTVKAPPEMTPVPPAIAQGVTTVAIKPVGPEIVHELSSGENPLPVIVTGVVPSGPELGVRVMLGAGAVTVKEA